MSTTGAFAVTFIFYHLFYIVFSLIMIISGLLTNFYLSAMNDNYVINNYIYVSFSFTTQGFIIIGIVVLSVSFMSCSILINDKTRTVIAYLLIMLIIIAAEFYVGFETLKIPGDVETTSNRILNKTFINVTSENSTETPIAYNNYSTPKPLSGKLKIANKTQSTKDSYDINSMWQNNCLTKSTDIAQRTTKLLCTIIFIIATFKVSGMLFFLYKYEWNKY